MKILEKFKEFSAPRKNIIKLGVCVVLILISAVIGSMIQTSGWTSEIKDLRNEKNSGTIELVANDTGVQATYTVSGEVNSGILIVPKNAKKNPGTAPGIVLTHGLYNNREMQLQNGIELARRGFVVVLIDRAGHGYNTTSYENYGDSMLKAAKYLYNLTDEKGNKLVDPGKIAVSGHSMGGNATNSSIGLDGVDTTTAITSGGTRYTWAGNTDEALKKGYHMGIISASITQANNAPSAVGSNMKGVAIIKASSDEFFFTSTLKEATYVAIDKDAMTELMFNQGVKEEYSGSEDKKIYVKKGSGYVAVTSKNHFSKSTQYYKFTKNGNSTDYLQSSQAAKFTRSTFAATDASWDTVNGAIYNYATGSIVTQPNGKKLSATQNKGAGYVDATNTQIRAIYEARETHPMNHFSTVSAAHIIDFMYATFGTPQGAKYKAPTNQTWWLKEAVAIVGIVAMFSLVVVLVGILLTTKTFASLAAQEGEVEANTLELLRKPRRHVSYWLSGLLTAIFGAWSLSKASEWSSSSLVMQFINNKVGRLTGLTYTDWANIGTIAYWSVLCGFVAIAISLVIYFINLAIDMAATKNGEEFVTEQINPLAPLKIRSASNVVKTLAVVFIVVGVFYGIVALLWKWMVVDFRIWTFDLKNFKLSNLPSYLRYVPFFAVYYVANSCLNQGFRAKDLPEWLTIIINVAFNVGALMLLFGVQNAHFIKTGGLISGTNKLFYIACYPIIPCVGVATVVSRRIYAKTGNAWLAGLINAVLFTILACANTSVNGIF